MINRNRQGLNVLPTAVSSSCIGRWLVNGSGNDTVNANNITATAPHFVSPNGGECKGPGSLAITPHTRYELSRFSILAAFYLDSTSIGNYVLHYLPKGAHTDGRGIRIQLDPKGRVVIFLGKATGSWYTIIIDHVEPFYDGCWHTIGFSYYATGDTSVYIDGKRVYLGNNIGTISWADNSGGTLPSAKRFWVGGDEYMGVYYPLSGTLQDIQYHDTNLSAAQVAAYAAKYTALNTKALRYVASFPSLATSARPKVISISVRTAGDSYFNNVLLQLPLRSHLRDESKAPRTVTVNGNTNIVNGAAYFDGNGDYLSFADSSDLELGTNAFALETWFKPSASGVLLSKRVVYATTYAPVALFINGSNNLGFASATNNTAYTINISGGPTITYGSQWYHAAVCRLGNVWLLYLNGLLVAQTTSSHSVYDIADAWIIGTSAADGGGGWYQGYIRDFRFTKGVARYTANFTPPEYLPIHGVAPPYGVNY